MRFGLKILSGNRANEVVEIKEGLVIGRSQEAHLSFDDPKMSGRHVSFKKTASGWQIEDLGSKNGFRVNGKKTQKTIVKSGSYIKVGSHEFELVDLSASAPARPKKTTVEKADPIPPPVEAPPVAVERLSWPEYFSQFTQMSLEKVKSKPKEVAPFSRAVKLEFLKGLQSETVWTLGYGPREVGSHSCDLVIEDPGAPPICFVLSPQGPNVIFKTDRPDLVLLNKKQVKSDNLKEGDLIEFATTVIQFGFAE